MAAPKPNPDPGHITPAMWRLWTEFDAHRPSTRLGGIYARKSGYHSTRNDNQRYWPGDYSIGFAADRKGPADKSAAIDLTFPEAQRGDFTAIRTYTQRLVAAAKARDPRLYRGSTPILREIIGTLDGRRTYAYDLQRRRGDHDRDSSHMWHIHLSVTRQFVTDWNALAGILSILIGDENDMSLKDTVHLTDGQAALLADDPGVQDGISLNTAIGGSYAFSRAGFRILSGMQGTITGLTEAVRQLAGAAGSPVTDAQLQEILTAVRDGAEAGAALVLPRLAEAQRAAAAALDGEEGGTDA